MTTTQKPHRFEELDSLRGVAAMVVVLQHATNCWDPPYPMWWQTILASPLGLMLAGSDAVLLFFVLSGFVLFLPYMTPKGPGSYSKFVIKRVCRIYLPYLGALALVLLADWYFYRPPGDVLAHHMPWTRPFPVWAILPHVELIGSVPFLTFNPVVWSLVHEMRISLAFPIIALLAMRVPLVGGLVGGFTLCGMGLMFLLSNNTEWATLGYAGLFLVGACLARRLDDIRAFAARIGPYGRGLGFVLAYALLKSTHSFPDRFKVFPVQGTLHGMAMALIVVLTLTTVWFKQLLHTRGLRWLGSVSYSLYLVHDTVTFSMMCLFWKKTEHHGWLIAAAVGVSLIVAELFHRWIERPSMLLGRRLGGKRRESEASSTAVSIAAPGSA